MPSQRPKVLSIVGPGRSGSTLVAQILGELPLAFNVGELRWLWQRGLRDHRPCGCGVPPPECAVWSEILVKALGPTLDAEFIAGMVARQRWVGARKRRIPVIRSADQDVAESSDLGRLRTTIGAVLDGVTAVTGARTVVDASKRPVDAAVLAGLPGMDHYVLHLVRDPRAVAFSWSRLKAVRTAGGVPKDMDRRSASHSAERWLEANLGCELLRRHVAPDRWLFLRYEDFATTPATELQRIRGWLGEPDTPTVDGNDTVHLRPNHTVAGNPIRFNTGDVHIKPDDEWTRRLGARRKAVVTAVTLPLLVRYGYPVRVPG